MITILVIAILFFIFLAAIFAIGVASVLAFVLAMGVLLACLCM